MFSKFKDSRGETEHWKCKGWAHFIPCGYKAKLGDLSEEITLGGKDNGLNVGPSSVTCKAARPFISLLEYRAILGSRGSFG